MKKFLTAFIIVFCIFAGVTRAYTNPGAPTGFVNDYASILDQNTVNSLNSELQNYKDQTGNEISVVTIPSLGGDTIENYANELFRDWGIGDKEKNNGVLFLIAVNDRKMRIEVGYGLEGAVTDIETKHIQDDTVAPFFKAGDYAGGIVEGTRLIEKAAAEDLDTSAGTSNNTPKLSGFGDYFFIFWMSCFALQWLVAVFSRSKSWWGGGVVGAGIGILNLFFKFILFSLFVNILIIIVLGGLGLWLDYVVSKRYQKIKNDGGRMPWWTGGGSGSSGGGFGGFGGGGSGGGGSSSSW